MGITIAALDKVRQILYHFIDVCQNLASYMITNSQNILVFMKYLNLSFIVFNF